MKISANLAVKSWEDQILGAVIRCPGNGIKITRNLGNKAFCALFFFELQKTVLPQP